MIQQYAISGIEQSKYFVDIDRANYDIVRYDNKRTTQYCSSLTNSAMRTRTYL